MRLDTSTKTRYLSLLIVSAALPLFALTLFSPFYQTNDDVAMRLLAEGKFAPGAGPTPFVMHMNIVVGAIVSGAYRLAPSVPWYDLVLGASMTAAATALLAVWIGSGKRVEVTWASLFALFFLLPAFVNVQFSVVGLGCAAAGLVLIGCGAFQPLDEPVRRVYTGIGAALFTWGALVRFEGAVLMAVEAALLAIPLIVSVWREAGGRRRLRQAMVAALVAFGLAIGSFALNQFVYTRSAGWHEFHEYNFHRSLLTEYITADRLTPDTMSQLGSKVGWSEADFALFRNWFFTDPELFSLAKVRRAETLFYRTPAAGAEDRRTAQLKRGLELTKSSFADMRMAVLVMALFVVAAGARRRVCLFFAHVAIVLVLLSVGIGMALKAPPLRVFWPMLVLAATMLPMAAARWSRPVPPLLGAAVTVAALVIAASAFGALWRETAVRRVSSDLARRDVERVTRTGARFFVLHGDAFPYEDFWRPLRVEKTPFPFIALGVSARTPPVQNALRRAGWMDLPLALCSERGLVLVARPYLPPLLVPFIAEHHALNVRFDPVFQGDRFTAWRCIR